MKTLTWTDNAYIFEADQDQEDFQSNKLHGDVEEDEDVMDVVDDMREVVIEPERKVFG